MAAGMIGTLFYLSTERFKNLFVLSLCKITRFFLPFSSQQLGTLCGERKTLMLALTHPVDPSDTHVS